MAGRGGPADRVEQCISENVSLILMPSVVPLPLCRGERGNFSIAEAVRQETGERENKSAPVWSLVTTRGKGIVQKDREGGWRCSDYREIMSFYSMSLCTRPQRAISP